MTVAPLRRRLERLEHDESCWRAYAHLPGKEWPDEALDAYIRESYPERFAGRPANDPITDEELNQMIAEADAKEDSAVDNAAASECSARGA